MKKKILFLIHTLGGGGAEKVLVNLVNNMSDEYDITLMTIIDTGIFKKDLNKNKIKYKTMFKVPNKISNSSNDISGSLLNKTSRFKKIMASCYSFFWKIIPIKTLYKWKIKEKYDIEVAFLEGITAKVISASNNPNSKKYVWIHVDLQNEKKSEKVFLNRKQEKKCYSKFDKIVCVSNVVKEKFIEKYNFDEKKVIIKYNPINDKDILEKCNEKINDMPKNKGGYTLVTIGRLQYQKGYDRLVRIAKKLKEDSISFKIYIIGVGPDEDTLKKYIIDNGLINYVELLGFKKNPYPYLKNADLFVCSSRAEGFSTVATEATILGIPIVTTDCSGMKELLGNSEYGLITENDEESLYKGLKKMLIDINIYIKYKEKIKERSNTFNLINSIKQIEEMFGDNNDKENI